MKTDKKEILQALLLSVARHYVLNIKLQGFQRPVKTAVMGIAHNRILLYPFAIDGQPVPRNVVSILDIEWVRSYDIIYGSPVLETIRSLGLVA